MALGLADLALTSQGVHFFLPKRYLEIPTMCHTQTECIKEAAVIHSLASFSLTGACASLHLVRTRNQGACQG